MYRTIIALGVLALTGCVAKDKTPVATAPFTATPYLNISTAPPADWPEDPPPKPEKSDSFADRLARATPEEQAKLWEEANGPPELMDEIGRLRTAFDQYEADNFVQMRVVRDETVKRDPAPFRGVEVWFKHDAEQTLAKYTDNPLFIAREGGFTDTDLAASTEIWSARLNEIDGSASLGSNAMTGEVEVMLGITEEKFRAIADEKGWTWGDDVKITFAEPPVPAFADPELIPLVRAFAREESSAVIQLTAGARGRIVADDGCFRLTAEKGQKGPLVLFGYDAQLDRDDEGYVIVTRNGEDTYRIGEPAVWAGPNNYEEDWSSVIALRKACGDGEVVNVGHPDSQRSFSLPFADWVLDYAKAKDMTYDEAWDEVIACMKRQGRKDRNGIGARDECIRQYNKRR